MSVTNRYPGLCACKAYVEAGEGHVFKDGTKYALRCAYCEKQATAPQREMLGCLYWPNGLGETECTAEYEEAAGAARYAREDRDAFERSVDAWDDETRAAFNKLDHAAYAAENKLAQLQFDGGHLGERITYDKPDPLAALMGGGEVSFVPQGDGMTVVRL